MSIRVSGRVPGVRGYMTGGHMELRHSGKERPRRRRKPLQFLVQRVRRIGRLGRPDVQVPRAAREDDDTEVGWRVFDEAQPDAG